MRLPLLISYFSLLNSLYSSLALATLDQEKVYTAELKKVKHYIRDGVIVGGDSKTDHIIVKGIRYSANAGYERAVIDLQRSQNESSSIIPRAPFFQTAVSLDERRIIVTLWGHPELQFKATDIQTAFKKSQIIRKVDLLPPVEEDRWTFVLELKSDSPVEVFELSDPMRLILDLQRKKS